MAASLIPLLATAQRLALFLLLVLVLVRDQPGRVAPLPTAAGESA